MASSQRAEIRITDGRLAGYISVLSSKRNTSGLANLGAGNIRYNQDNLNYEITSNWALMGQMLYMAVLHATVFSLQLAF